MLVFIDPLQRESMMVNSRRVRKNPEEVRACDARSRPGSDGQKPPQFKEILADITSSH